MILIEDIYIEVDRDVFYFAKKNFYPPSLKYLEYAIAS